jgi:membrane protein required for colicin V production
MVLLDLLLGGMVAASALAGFLTGFTRAAIGILAAIAAVLLGFWLFEIPARWYADATGSEMAANLLGFLTVFAVTLAMGTLAARLFSGLFRLVGLGFFDRLAGAAFGCLRGALVAAAATAVLLAATPQPAPSWMRDSKLLPYAMRASGWATSLAPRALKDAVRASIDEIQRAWDEEVRRAKRKALEAAGLEPEPELPAAPPPAKIVKNKSKMPKSPPPKPVKQ